MNLARWLHWLRHDWQLVRDTGLVCYEQCSVCNRRRATPHGPVGIVGPIDLGWIETGRWTGQIPVALPTFKPGQVIALPKSAGYDFIALRKPSGFDLGKLEERIQIKSILHDRRGKAFAEEDLTTYRALTELLEEIRKRG